MIVYNLQLVCRTVCEFHILTIIALKSTAFLALNKLKYWRVTYIVGSESALLSIRVEDQTFGALKTVEFCIAN
jgi:hypothetical protein